MARSRGCDIVTRSGGRGGGGMLLRLGQGSYVNILYYLLQSRPLSSLQTQCQLGELKAEVDLLHSKLQAERVRVEQLQTLVSVERQKEFVAHMTGKERDEELQHLRQLMTNLEADRQVEKFNLCTIYPQIHAGF